MIRIENVSYKYYGREKAELENINLQIEKGEFILLCGSTGCGKSTLLKCLNGIIPHESRGEFTGNVYIKDMNTRKYPIRVLSEKVGLLFQNPDEQIFQTIVSDEVAFGLENLCFPEEEIKERIMWALEKVNMLAFIDSPTNALSGGQKQRVALASVLSLKPEILVLDEPISQLDPKGAREVLKVVQNLRDEGMTIILVEHRLHEVISWADRVIVMDKGKIFLDEKAKNIETKLDVFKNLGLRIPIKNNIDYHKIFKKYKDSKPQSLENKKKVIEVKNLYYSYEKKKKKRKNNMVLKGIDLDIYEGEIVGILGNNGSGKSTLMYHMAGIYKPSEGDIIICGKNTKKTSAYNLAGTCSILFQNAELMLTCDTIYDEVSFGPRNLKYSKEKVKEITENKLLELEIEDLKEFHPQSVSGGQRLRCAAASILSMNPKILLLDEPTSGQDIKHIRKLLKLCRNLTFSGVTTIFITHDYEVAVKYTDRLIYIEDGKISMNVKTSKIRQEEKTV
ncbi:ABC transporter ATP-binding protein [Clostridium sp. BJN0001]|uniref:ABC transporter ATP-binding protein n=1 Tax=Clostridium sp. BJN0001 TaxID=2930219 RepID=UPI001FD3D254|nr:ABC transporter ATP-binding protein [Clostridium sp. BJN0001]